jgi:hypothetical protein
VRWPSLRFVVFYDNNIGGNLPYLRQLCEALRPLRIKWGSSITFNTAAKPELVRAMSDAGCRFLYVGLESFNGEALNDMRKYHNAVHKTRRLVEECQRCGILVMSGLMLSPLMDDAAYIRSTPQRLAECGLHAPSYVCFETPLPGTAHFYRLARQPDPALLPNALLRDFNTYTLVVRPRSMPVGDFVDAYKWLVNTVFRPANRAVRLAHDLPRLLRGGWFLTALLDVLYQVRESQPAVPAGRTYIAGTEPAPAETGNVPLTPGDFRSEDEWHAIMDPWRVTDEAGHVLAMWRNKRNVAANDSIPAASRAA